MLYTAVGFFSLAAILGMTLAFYIFKDKETPKGIVFLHGPLAAAGLIILIIYALKDGPDPIESIILFTIAAMSGVVMFSRDITGRPVPKWLAAVHGLIAVCGFIML